jgi:phage gp37-like protein
MPGNNDEASIPMEDERNGERMSARRKFANMLKYFNPFSTIPLQDEDTPAAKRPRLQAYTSISTAEDADTVVDERTTDKISALPVDTEAVAPAHAVAVTVAAASLPSSRASRAHTPRRKWNLEEDAKLTDAVKEFGNDWVRVAALVSFRTRTQCRQRWFKYMDDQTAAHMQYNGRWTLEEDAKLSEAVTELGGNNWTAVSALVPGRTNRACCNRWSKYLGPTINTGKFWTVEEDAKLAEAVKKLGNNWVQVAAMVTGRTNRQCRQRWAENVDPDVNTGKWTLDEDAKLTGAVKKHGGDNWAAVSVMVPGRTNKQCHYRWASTLDPEVNRGKFSVEEDAKLTDAVKEFGNDWLRVAALVPGRTNEQCRQRWFKYMDDQTAAHMQYNGRWTLEEDAKLSEAVTELGGNNWTAVSALVPGRTNRACCNRWSKYLGPTINTGKFWTVEEDAKLAEAVKKLGNNWVQVAAMVTGRTNRQCRQRWAENVDPDVNTGKWTLDEDAKLTGAVKKHGGDNWAAVSVMVPGRTNKQCHYRWASTLDPEVNRGKFSVEEDAKLTDAVTEFGNDWLRVAALVPGRTNEQCRQRWSNHSSPEHFYNARPGTC